MGFCHQVSTLVKLDDILKIATCCLVSTLTNTNDKIENLAIYYQVYIYKSGSPLPISYLRLRQSFIKS